MKIINTYFHQLLFTCFILWGFNMPLTAQQLSPEFVIGKPKQNLNEPSVIINPKNIHEAIIATNPFHLFVVNDQGKTLKYRKMESSHGVYGDPILLADQNKNIFYGHLSKTEGLSWPQWFEQIVIQKSSDGGKSWSDGVGIGKNGKMQDKPWMSIDEQTGSPFRNRIYLTWTQFDQYKSKNPNDSSRILFSYSQDDANTFSKPIVISDVAGDVTDDDGTMEGATTCSDNKGCLYALWAGRGNLFLDKSLDGGNTWGPDKKVLEIPGGWNLESENFLRTNGLPFLHADSSGTLYVVTAFSTAGKYSVVFISSDDQGSTWSEPFFLQNQAEFDYVMPNAWLDKSNGNYYVIYYAFDKQNANILLSYKLAGENRFKTIQVNEKPFLLSENKHFIGDYLGIHARGNRVLLSWTEVLKANTVVKYRWMKLE